MGKWDKCDIGIIYIWRGYSLLKILQFRKTRPYLKIQRRLGMPETC